MDDANPNKTETPVAVEAVAKTAVAAFLDTGRAREKVVPLEWPITYAGEVYSELTVRRCTGLEISEYLIEQSQNGRSLFPGISCPLAVYDQLDADDLEAVDAVVRDFLPRSFRQAGESPPST